MWKKINASPFPYISILNPHTFPNKIGYYWDFFLKLRTLQAHDHLFSCYNLTVWFRYSTDKLDASHSSLLKADEPTKEVWRKDKMYVLRKWHYNWHYSIECGHEQVLLHEQAGTAEEWSFWCIAMSP